VRRGGADTLVVIPAFNEREALPGTLRELREVVPQYDVLVVDDGSADDTAAQARAEGVEVVRLPFNLGVGGAVRTGLHYARDEGYQRAVVFDADGQHSPQAISALLAALDDGADLAVGSRFMEGADHYQLGRSRRRAMRLLQTVVRRLSGQAFTDTTSGFRAFDRPVIDLLARDYPAEYLADTVEVLLMVAYEGFRIVEVPASMRARTLGQPSNRNLKLVLNYLRLLVGIVSSASRRAKVLRARAAAAEAVGPVRPPGTTSAPGGAR
jgi:glycosyltransferase involved in cell wall biosynthesis